MPESELVNLEIRKKVEADDIKLHLRRPEDPLKGYEVLKVISVTRRQADLLMNRHHGTWRKRALQLFEWGREGIFVQNMTMGHPELDPLDLYELGLSLRPNESDLLKERGEEPEETPPPHEPDR